MQGTNKTIKRYWRNNEEINHECRTIDNIYKYDSYTSMILKYPMLAPFISREEWQEYKAKYLKNIA